MSNKKPSVAVVGAGMGGLAVAATLLRVGFDVQVYEQAARFGRIGAGIQMMPNSMKVLRGIGIEQRLRQTSFAPYSHLNRVTATAARLRANCRCRRVSTMHHISACIGPTYMMRLPRQFRRTSCIWRRSSTASIRRAAKSPCTSKMGRGRPRMRWSARMAYIRSCATSWSGLTNRSTKAASRIARYFRRA